MTASIMTLTNLMLCSIRGLNQVMLTHLAHHVVDIWAQSCPLNINNQITPFYSAVVSTYYRVHRSQTIDNWLYDYFDNGHAVNNAPSVFFCVLIGTNNIFISHIVAYCILIIPNVIMGVVITSLLLLFLCDKISAKEIYRWVLFFTITLLSLPSTLLLWNSTLNVGGYKGIDRPIGI